MVKNLGESIRQQLKNLSERKNRPFDEVLRYYAMERFLYRLYLSPYKNKFFLKGALMLKVWDAMDHRATMDIDLLARLSNKMENLRSVIVEICAIPEESDAITFNTQKLILRETQTGGDYHGISASFSALLFSTKIPILIDIGFNDVVIPEPQKIHYPTLLPMSAPELLGYTLETVIAEKLESTVKLGLVNTRMKDFYDLWTISRKTELNAERVKLAIKEVFANRGTKIKFPVAFSKAFYDNAETSQRWYTFLKAMGKDHIALKNVVVEISDTFGSMLK